MGLGWPAYYHKLFEIFRPWAVPFFFSLFGPYTLESAKVIVMAQTYIAFAAWTLFALSLLRFFHTRATGWIAVALVASLMFSQGYYHVNQYLQSDSLALSSVLLQWAACVSGRPYLQWAAQQRHTRALIGLYIAAVTVLTAFAMSTRDPNIMLALGGLAFVILDTRPGLLPIRAGAILVALVMLTTVAQVNQAHRRHNVNVINLLAGFVLPDPQARKFFTDRGMPQTLADFGPGLRKQEFGSVDNQQITSQRKRIYSAAVSYQDHFYPIYAEYMVSHPAWVASTAYTNRGLIFEWECRSSGSAETAPLVDLEKPSTVIIGPTLRAAVTDLLPLKIWLAIYGLSLAGTVVLAGWRRALLPALVGGLGAANAVAAFFADLWDPNEMARHALIGSTVLRIGIVVAFAVVLDAAIYRRKQPAITPT